MDIGDFILFMVFKYLVIDWMVVLKWKCEKIKKNVLNKVFNNIDMVYKECMIVYEFRFCCCNFVINDYKKYNYRYFFCYFV